MSEIIEAISKPPVLHESEVSKRMRRNVKAFDEYERREAYSV